MAENYNCISEIIYHLWQCLFKPPTFHGKLCLPVLYYWLYQIIKKSNLLPGKDFRSISTVKIGYLKGTFKDRIEGKRMTPAVVRAGNQHRITGPDQVKAVKPDSHLLMQRGADLLWPLDFVGSSTPRWVTFIWAAPYRPPPAADINAFAGRAILSEPASVLWGGTEGGPHR